MVFVIGGSTTAFAASSTPAPSAPATSLSAASGTTSATATAAPGPAATHSSSPASAADVYDPNAVTDVPPAPAGTASFTYTSSRNISPGKWQTIYTGCPAGWYVRPGTPSVWTPADITASYHQSTGPDVDNSDDDGVSQTYPTTGDGNIFQNMSVQFHNWSLLSSHHASVTFWCDAVPSWYASPSAATGDSVRMGATQGIGPGCWYCSTAGQYQNLATKMMLDPNGGDGGQVLVQNSTGDSSQNWYLEGSTGGSDFYDGVATYGLWQDPGDIDPVLSTAIAAGGGGYQFVSDSGGSPPSGGQFSYIDWGAGQVYNAVMFVETDTIGSGGGTCIEADGGAGTPVTAEPCDATNQAQWWIVEDPK
ncbi:hypothetical protein [Subtercola endophyticus]|uniref:hypothetical protein n=1 Tax=Subtercola endophyticus TaxID=2895559 RepID=UPI001E36F5F9|nr:hypothetical protein [Subtercola endophyticus]UFS58172.1 hypothetical protein LQ955_14265 [Subtercola endophyticus]